MTTHAAALIRTHVTASNAKAIERDCQAHLCFAHAYQDTLDYEAMRGKIAQAQEAQKPTYYPNAGMSLTELLEVFGIE